MALGTLTMLLGIGSEYAMTAFVTFLLAHSLYKGALFMVAGILDHETGTKDVTAMGGTAQRDARDGDHCTDSSAFLGGCATVTRLYR